MTNEEMDRAIAEHLGWTGIRMSNVWEITDPPEYASVLCGHRPDGRLRAVPRYSSDLNAIHEVEGTLADDGAYVRHLNRVTCRRDGFDDLQWYWRTIRAEAHQRAEAVLRTIGKYSDATHPLP